MDRDPASEKVSDSNRETIVSLGPVQPKIDFPTSTSRKLKFQSAWYSHEKYSNGWNIVLSRKMLHIVSFVVVSALSSAVQKNSLSKMDLKVGIKLWGEKTGRFSMHTNSTMHRLSTERYLNFTTSLGLLYNILLVHN